jgi:hypothetical protein
LLSRSDLRYSWFLRAKNHTIRHPCFCFQLAARGAALIFPRDLSFLLPDRRLEIASTLVIFGRSLQITGSQLTMVALLYGITFLWNLGSTLFRPSLCLMSSRLELASCGLQLFP